MPYAFAQRGFERGPERSYAPRYDRGGARGFDRTQDQQHSAQLIPLNQVIAGVSRQFGGRVLDASMGNGGHPVYYLKVLTGDGNVLAVTVDAQSGQVLAVRGRR